VISLQQYVLPLVTCFDPSPPNEPSTVSSSEDLALNIISPSLSWYCTVGANGQIPNEVQVSLLSSSRKLSSSGWPLVLFCGLVMTDDAKNPIKIPTITIAILPIMNPPVDLLSRVLLLLTSLVMSGWLASTKSLVDFW